jgi:hypothetical protein
MLSKPITDPQPGANSVGTVILVRTRPRTPTQTRGTIAARGRTLSHSGLHSYAPKQIINNNPVEWGRDFSARLTRTILLLEAE